MVRLHDSPANQHSLVIIIPIHARRHFRRIQQSHDQRVVFMHKAPTPHHVYDNGRTVPCAYWKRRCIGKLKPSTNPVKQPGTRQRLLANPRPTAREPILPPPMRYAAHAQPSGCMHNHTPAQSHRSERRAHEHPPTYDNVLTMHSEKSARTSTRHP